MAQPDFYKILGVPRNAGLADLKSAYRKLAVTWHPDRNPGSRLAEERFKSIAEAYAVLSSPDKRRQYDMMGPDEFRHEFSREDIFKGFEPGDLFNFFGLENASETLERLFSEEREGEKRSRRHKDRPRLEEFFSGFGQKSLGPGGRQRSPAIMIPLLISLCEAVFGAVKTVAYNTPQGAKKLTVTIPRGAAGGQKIMLKNQGPAMAGALPGDIMVTLSVKPDDDFKLKGADIVTRLNLPEEKLSGAEKVVVSTLDGRKLRVSIPPAARYGIRLKIPGHGAYREDGTRGDLLVTLQGLRPKPGH